MRTLGRRRPGDADREQPAEDHVLGHAGQRLAVHGQRGDRAQHAVDHVHGGPGLLVGDAGPHLEQHMRPFGRAHPLDASDAAAGIVIERAIRLDEDVAQVPVAQLQLDGGVDEPLERDQGRRVLVEHFVDRSPPEERRLLDEQRKELALALEVAVDGGTAHPGRRTDVGQARLAEATLPEQFGGRRHDRLPGAGALGRTARLGGCGASSPAPAGVRRVPAMRADVSHESQKGRSTR